MPDPKIGGGMRTGRVGTQSTVQDSAGPGKLAGRSLRQIQGGAPPTAQHRSVREPISRDAPSRTDLSSLRQQPASGTGVSRRTLPKKPFITSDELVRRMGRKPRKDVRLFFGHGPTLHRASREYKSTLKGLGRYQQLLRADLGHGKTEISDRGAELKAVLDEAARSANAYIQKHQASESRSGAQLPAMRDLVKLVAKEKQLLDAVLANSRSETFGPLLSWGEAKEFMRIGMPLTLNAKVGDFTDENAIAADNSFGSGMVNTVAKVTYALAGGNVDKIFKAEEAEHTSKALQPLAIGIDESAPRFGNRNVATYLLSKALSLSVIPQTGFAMHEGKIGTAMEFVPGKALLVPRPADVEDLETVNTYLDLPNREEALEQLARKGLVEKHGQWINLTGGASDLPYEDPNVMRQISNLEWVDALTGQVDRHVGNILFRADPETGATTVAGIDNDFSFGRKLDTVTALQDGTEGNWDKRLTGLPMVVDARLAEAIESLDWEGAKSGLEGLLDGPELAATEKRLNQLKGHVATLRREGLVIEDWSANVPKSPPERSVLEHLKAEAKTTRPSYLLRDIKLRDARLQGAD